MIKIFVLAAAALSAVSVPSAADNPIIGKSPFQEVAALTIPALTPVSIEILAPLGSKISKTGEMFPIRLAAPIVIDGREAIPAGVEGLGEVVHAKKSGGMGAAGELVLAARYVEVDGARLKLRSMRLAVAGKSNIDTVNAINVGSAASPIPFGLIGFFISGGQITIPAGTRADAKVSESFTLPASPKSDLSMPASSTTFPKQGEIEE